jgi:hypothetical protein
VPGFFKNSISVLAIQKTHKINEVSELMMKCPK